MATATVTDIAKARPAGALTKSEEKIVKRCVKAYERMLEAAVPELISGLRVSGKQSSLSTTTTLKKAKGRNITTIVAPRVRAAREAEEFQIHLTDDNQLELGWVDVSDEEEETEGADGGEAQAGHRSGLLRVRSLRAQLQAARRARADASVSVRGLCCLRGGSVQRRTNGD